MLDHGLPATLSIHFPLCCSAGSGHPAGENTGAFSWEIVLQARGLLFLNQLLSPPLSLQTQFIPLGSRISHWRDSYCLHSVFSHFPVGFSWRLAALLLYPCLSCFASQTGFESGLSNLVKCSKCVSSSFCIPVCDLLYIIVI